MLFKRLITKAKAFYERSVKYITGRKLEITIFNPRYLANCFLNRNIKSLADYTNGTLLDVGCGNKAYYGVFNTRCDIYLGLDLPRTSKVMAIDLNPDIIADAAYSLPIKSESIDSVLLLQVLEHLAEPKRVIAETNRILEKGGVLILSTRQIYPIHGEPFDFFRFTKYSLKYLLEKNNFIIEKIRAEGSFWTMIGFMYNIYIFDFLFKGRRRVFTKRLLFGIKVILTPLLLILIAVINSICLVLNAISPQIDNFASNYFVIARKK